MKKAEKKSAIVHCFITAFGSYRIDGDVARLLHTMGLFNKRTKRYKSLKELEGLILQLDQKLYEHGCSLTDLSFK